MRAQPRYIPYRQTGAFSSLVMDYLNQDPALSGLYAHPPDLEGIRSSIEQRKRFTTDRALLVSQLTEQYRNMPGADKAREQIALLSSGQTFTVCTAHQPNIFTGHLYFIYKILHAIRLSDELNAAFPGSIFIPVYYMGSEDADLDELGEVHIRDKHYRWQTKQQGAVGRMVVDQPFLEILSGIKGQLSVDPHGPSVMSLLQSVYTKGKTIEQATFELVHALFGQYGLLVLLPDNASYKSIFREVCKRELLEQFSFPLVFHTVSGFPEKYKVQAAGREINLFYLGDQLRERIIRSGQGFSLAGGQKLFTQEELLTELQDHPERFSPNVILRPVYQEMLLPNVAFIGGGGELAYWLELKAVFEASGVPYPVLLLRNSFMLISPVADDLLQKLSLSDTDVFRKTLELQSEIAKRESEVKLDLEQERNQLIHLYGQIAHSAGRVDVTLSDHSQALQQKALRKLEALEKKMLRSAKKKSESSLRQLDKIKHELFPGGSLQERYDNIFSFLSKHGLMLIDDLYAASQGLRQEFTILHI